MFDPYTAFSPLHGKAFDNLRDLFRALGQVRWDHLAELPVNYGVRELMDLARERHWLTEDEEGRLHIELTPAPVRQSVRSLPNGQGSEAP